MIFGTSTVKGSRTTSGAGASPTTSRGVRRGTDGGVEVCAADDPAVLTHDPALLDPSTAFAVSRLAQPTPVGIFRAVSRPTYDDLMQHQVDLATSTGSPADLGELLRAGDTWQIS